MYNKEIKLGAMIVYQEFKSVIYLEGLLEYPLQKKPSQIAGFIRWLYEVSLTHTQLTVLD